MTKRKLTIGSIEYFWHCGSTYVPIWRGNTIIACPTLSEITGKDWQVIEHDKHKENFRLTPGQVVKYICEKILT